MRSTKARPQRGDAQGADRTLIIVDFQESNRRLIHADDLLGRKVNDQGMASRVARHLHEAGLIASRTTQARSANACRPLARTPQPHLKIKVRCKAQSPRSARELKGSVFDAKEVLEIPRLPWRDEIRITRVKHLLRNHEGSISDRPGRGKGRDIDENISGGQAFQSPIEPDVFSNGLRADSSYRGWLLGSWACCAAAVTATAAATDQRCR